MSDPAVVDPRSPRSDPPGDLPGETATPTLTGDTSMAFATPSPFVDVAGPQRPNIGSMLFLTAFFFFMSSNNTQPQMIIIGPDGQIQARVTELDRARLQVDEYKSFINGTTNGNWTEGGVPVVLPSSLLPSKYNHQGLLGKDRFYTNITGFHRDGQAHTVDLVNTIVGQPQDGFFSHVNLPNLNSSESNEQWNETLAEELKAGWDWIGIDKWEMNIKERNILANDTTSTKSRSVKKIPKLDSLFDDDEWSWVRGTVTLHQNSTGEASKSLEYDILGLHFIPNGTYELYGVPDGAYLDLRNIPRLYPDHHNTTRTIIMRELQKELDVQEGSLLLTDVRPEDQTRPRCPLLMHLALPPIPAGMDIEDIIRYDRELSNPTGLRTSMIRPPQYWQHGGLGGLIVADQCGFAIGLEGGKGVKLDDFWRKSINYAAFATVSQLLVLFLLVRQMELTRTPSTLSKVSLWSIVLMGAADSWIFSAHVAVGTMSDNKTSLPLLIPGFLALCTAIVFGPRYAVLLYRVQAPERVSEPATTPRPAPTPAPTTGQAANVEAAEEGNVTPVPDEENRSVSAAIQEYFDSHPRVKWLLVGFTGFMLFQLVFVPSFLPIFLFGLYSFWLPQIWRNATRGSIGVNKAFILGTSTGRLALPMYALGCPDNVFFFETSSWIWSLVLWQAIQIMVLFAQERFGPSFFLPKRFAPAQGYDYHPIINPESPLDSKIEGKEEQDDRTCSICMEEVDVRPSSSSTTSTTISSTGEHLLAGIGGANLHLNINQKKSYALAPCGHLFHTNCLAQWLAVKTICPLCKRSLPPL